MSEEGAYLDTNMRKIRLGCLAFPSDAQHVVHSSIPFPRFFLKLPTSLSLCAVAAHARLCFLSGIIVVGMDSVAFHCAYTHLLGATWDNLHSTDAAFCRCDYDVEAAGNWRFGSWQV